MKPDRSRATSPDRLFALHRASEHLQKVETRGITRACEVAEPSGNGPETRANAGDRTACKAVYIGSIPVRASKIIKDLNPLRRVFSSAGKSGKVVFAARVAWQKAARVDGAIGRGREFAMPTKR